MSITAREKEITSRVSRKGSTGAVYVEFLVAVVPMFTLFWGIAQLNGLLLADVVAQHAAVTAVRAAVVCEPDDHSQRPETGQQCADAAVREILGLDRARTVSSIRSAEVSLSGASATGIAPVTATVSVRYQCEVPLVGWLVCGLAGRRSGLSWTTIVRSATLPNQGAFYAYSD
jgi:Flp pilus assembly protein TadG